MTKVPYGVTAVVLAIVATVTACGAERGGGEIVARVGGRPITRVALAHWMEVLAPQHMVPDPSHSAALYQALKRQALDFLISSDWLLGEAAAQGTPVGEREVQRRLRERERTFPGGRSEFEESVKAIAHTRSDVKLEIANEVASSKVRRRLSQDEPSVTAAEIADYYTRNLPQFEHAEQRQFYIVENIDSEQAARTLMGEFARGTRRISKSGNSLREHLDRPGSMREARPIVKAIFAARPGVVSKPVRVESFYFLVQVAKVTPAHRETLAEARGAIRASLASEQRQRTLARFIVAWRRRWTAKTSCNRRYVVQNCRQYVGARTREELLSLT